MEKRNKIILILASILISIGLIFTVFLLVQNFQGPQCIWGMSCKECINLRKSWNFIWCIMEYEDWVTYEDCLKFQKKYPIVSCPVTLTPKTQEPQCMCWFSCKECVQLQKKWANIACIMEYEDWITYEDCLIFHEQYPQVNCPIDLEYLMNKSLPWRWRKGIE